MNTEITSFNSTFFEYLCGFIWFDQDKLEALMKRYPIGATEQGESIFWHINAENKITNGHIITMDSETGKIYDDSWYYQDGRPTCMFGEHLIGAFPSQTVALVTDELTAAVMSCFPTPYVWLATGKEQATPSDLLPLVGASSFQSPVSYLWCDWESTRWLPQHCPDGSQPATTTPNRRGSSFDENEGCQSQHRTARRFARSGSGGCFFHWRRCYETYV